MDGTLEFVAALRANVIDQDRFQNDGAQPAVAELDVAAHKSTIGSAHVMGGCPMGNDPKKSVTNVDGKFHHLDNLYIMDGSLFPTSIGANPQLSIYGLTYKLANQLSQQFKA